MSDLMATWDDWYGTNAPDREPGSMSPMAGREPREQEAIYECTGCRKYIVFARMIDGEVAYEDRGSENCPYCDAHVQLIVDGKVWV